MKYWLLLFICLQGHALFGQGVPDYIWGSWVKTKLAYKDGTELPEENILRNTFVKYTFSVPDKLNISQLYYENGSQFIFEILNNEIILRSPEGSILNEIRIEELGPSRMVLLQRGHQGFDDPTALRYTFVPEADFQSSLPLTADDIYSVSAGDTIYKENPKIYANFKGDGFQKYLYDRISDGDGNYMTGRAGHLSATFIVSKTGIADSLKIREGINADFDKRFIKAFNKAKKDWKPGVLNGKNVPVLMFMDLNYSTFGPAFSAYEFTDKANIAFKAKRLAGGTLLLRPGVKKQAERQREFI